MHNNQLYCHLLLQSQRINPKRRSNRNMEPIMMYRDQLSSAASCSNQNDHEIIVTKAQEVMLQYIILL